MIANNNLLSATSPALLQVASQTTNRKLQACLAAAGHSLALSLASCLATTRHLELNNKELKRDGLKVS
jgi:hypothetical protein